GEAVHGATLDIEWADGERWPGRVAAHYDDAAPPRHPGDGLVEVRMAGGVPVDVDPFRGELGQRPIDILGPVIDGAVGAWFPAPGQPFGVAGRDHGSGPAGPGELQDGGADIARAAVDENGLTSLEPCVL